MICLRHLNKRRSKRRRSSMIKYLDITKIKKGKSTRDIRWKRELKIRKNVKQPNFVRNRNRQQTSKVSLIRSE